MTADGVPPWARPVMEALRDAARWMHFGAERVVEGGPSPITKQHAAWLELDSCCVAALASDAGTPDTTMEDLSRDAVHEPSPAAPDAELDRLLEDYGEEWGERARMQVGWTEGDLARSVAIIAEYRAAIHAHVARVKREARDNARAAAYAEITVRRDNERRAKEAPDAHP